LNRRLDGPRAGLEVFGENKNPLPLPGYEPKTVQPLAHPMFGKKRFITEVTPST
jgi:hypothetical protein